MASELLLWMSPLAPVDLSEMVFERNLMSPSLKEGAESCQSIFQLNHRSHNKPDKEKKNQTTKITKKHDQICKEKDLTCLFFYTLSRSHFLFLETVA